MTGVRLRSGGARRPPSTMVRRKAKCGRHICRWCVVPHLANTAWIWALQLLRIPDQLGAVPHQLPQLPSRRPRNPRLRQPAHPQQISKIAGVSFVILHPSVLERLEPQRVCQVHLRNPGRAARRPPSTTSGDSPARAIAQDSLSTSLLIRTHSNGSPSSGGDPDDHRPSPMQIDSHELPTRI